MSSKPFQHEHTSFSSRAFCHAEPTVWNCLPAVLTNNGHGWHLLYVVLKLTCIVDHSIYNTRWSSMPAIYQYLRRVTSCVFLLLLLT